MLLQATGKAAGVGFLAFTVTTVEVACFDVARTVADVITKECDVALSGAVHELVVAARAVNQGNLLESQRVTSLHAS